MSIADIVIITIILVSVIIGIIKGFVKSLVGMISLVVAIFIASLVAVPISGWVYDSYLQKPISEAIGIRVVSPMGFRTGLVTSNRFALPTSASVADLQALGDVEGILASLDPAYVESLDPAETQKFVNFLCSPVCSGKTLSSCTSAYNKKYGTDIDIAPILNTYGVASSTKVPALVSITGIKIDVEDAIVNVQEENEIKAVAASAAAASKAASSVTSKATSSATSKASSSKATSSATSRVTSSAASKATSSAASSKTASSKATSSRVTSAASSAAASSLSISSVDEVSAELSQPQDSEQTASNPLSDTVRGVAIKVISCVIFILVSVIVRALLGLIARALDKVVRKIPVVRGVNRVLGGVVGLIDGALTAILVVVAFTFLSPVITDSPVYTKAIEDSYICTKVRDVIYSDTTGTFAGLFPGGETSGENFSEDDFDFSE